MEDVGFNLNVRVCSRILKHLQDAEMELGNNELGSKPLGRSLKIMTLFHVNRKKTTLQLVSQRLKGA